MSYPPRLLLVALLTASPPLAAGGEASLVRGRALRAEEGARSSTLHAMQLGVDALQLGRVGEARSLFLEAVAGIEVIYGESEQAARARSLKRAESEKIFKGEPYERSLAFYYSGVTYLLSGELDNALASFRGAILHDALAEEAQFQCDSAALHFLAAWAGRRIGYADWPSLHARAVALRPALAGLDPAADVLVVAELGRGPRKRTDGIGHNQLRFFPGRGFSERSARLSVGGGELPLLLAEDVFHQASTRGGRKIDSILDEKVVFVRDAADSLSALGGSEGTIGDSTGTTLSDIDVGGIVQGLIIMSRADVNATADARYWNNLPATIHLATPALDPGQYELRFEFRDERGALLPELSSSSPLEVVAGRPSVLWLSSRERWGYGSGSTGRGGMP